MRNMLFMLLAVASLLVSCHESLEKRVQREAREYTQKNCPTPWNNGTRTDSVVFDIPTLTYISYCSVTGKADNALFINANRRYLTDGLRANVNSDPGCKGLKEAGYNFRYVLRSYKNPKQVLYTLTLTKKDYAQSVLPKAGGKAVEGNGKQGL